MRYAMPSATAKRKCPNLIFVKPRFDVYRAVWLQIRAIFAATRIIEPLSLDEAYLDVTENLQRIVSATQIAQSIRAKIRTDTDLTASAGVSYANSSPSSPRIIAGPMASSSLHRRWGLPSSKDCRSRSSTASGRRRQRR